MGEIYNILNDIEKYKNDICQILADIKKINDRLNYLNDLLNKHINIVCRDLPYFDNLIVSDQLYSLIDIEYILQKYKIFYGYAVIDNKYISYNYFKLENGQFSNTFNRGGVTSDYLIRDLKTLDHILNGINDIIDMIK